MDSTGLASVSSWQCVQTASPERVRSAAARPSAARTGALRAASNRSAITAALRNIMETSLSRYDNSLF
jgi:hypothetical protein